MLLIVGATRYVQHPKQIPEVIFSHLARRQTQYIFLPAVALAKEGGSPELPRAMTLRKVADRWGVRSPVQRPEKQTGYVTWLKKTLTLIKPLQALRANE